MAGSSTNYVPANTTGSAAIVIVAYFFTFTSILIVALRFWARKIQRLEYATDDWLVLAALPVLLGHNAIILTSVYLGGIGHRQETLKPENGVALYQTLTALQFSFGVSLGLIKASILVLLMRIFVKPNFKLAARTLLAYVIAWALMCILIGSAMCRPFNKNWNPELPGRCGDRMAAYIAIAATDIVGDLMIIVLPIPDIWALHASLRTKIALSIIFAVIALDVIVGILRIIYLVDLTRAKDYTYAAVNCWIWSTLEPSLAMAVACAPTLRPIGALFRRSRQTSYDSHGRYDRDHATSKTLRALNSTEQSTLKDDDDTLFIDLDGRPGRSHRAWTSVGHQSSQNMSDEESLVGDAKPELKTVDQEPNLKKQGDHSSIYVRHELTITSHEAKDSPRVG